MTSPFPTLPAPLSQALADKGYETLTPVQAAIVDPALIGKDLLVSAQTGSGKTVAFGMAMATDIMPDGAMLPPPDSPRALVIAPTRELALQVRREFEWLWGKAGAVLASCVGGMDVRTERRTLERGAHIVVGTPGRLRDHIERGTIDLSAVQAVTLDEADEMLDLGFREDLEFILQALPQERRTLLFSATVSKDIERLARTYQRDAQRVATTSSREAHADIAYRALVVSPQDAENAIVNLLRFYEARNALVFCKTRAAVNHLTARFLNRGFSVVPLSGELAQEERARALQAMRDGRARVCVATDVAARGIDLPGLELVIHADLPSNKETLLHRSGRTGRAGNKGVSALIVPISQRKKTERLLQMAQLEAEWGPAPSAADVSGRDTERLLSDEALTKPEDQAETSMITQLTDKFDQRALAAAVLRLYFAARSAPEDVAQISADGVKPRAHNTFGPSFWMRISAGHTQRAEPRWLLPMLCRSGNLTKDDIGAIRIFDDHTLVQLLESSRERFETAMGSAMQLEQGINVTAATAPADTDRPAPRPRFDDRKDSRPPRKDDDRPRTPYVERAKPAYKGPTGDDESRPTARPPRPERAGFDDAPKAVERPNAEDRAPRPDRPAKPAYAGKAEGSAPRPDRKPYAPREGGAERKPYAPREGGAERRDYKSGDRTGPAKPRSDKPFNKPRTDRPSEPRSDAKPADRARMDPKAAMNTSARMDGKPARKAPAKPFGKPAGKFSGKPGAKPARPRPPGGDSRPKR